MPSWWLETLNNGHLLSYEYQLPIFRNWGCPSKRFSCEWRPQVIGHFGISESRRNAHMLLDILFDLILLSTVPLISTKQTTSSYIKQYNMQFFGNSLFYQIEGKNYFYPVYAISIMYGVTDKTFRRPEEIVYIHISSILSWYMYYITCMAIIPLYDFVPQILAGLPLFLPVFYMS